MNNTSQNPSALLLLSSHCPHCPAVLDSLSMLIKQGELAELQVINIEQQPDVAQQYGVRSVPWIKIGDYQLSGLQTQQAMQQRIDWIRNQQQLSGQFDSQLSTGRASEVIAALEEDPERMQAIMNLLADSGTILSTRIGIGVIMEEFAGSELLQQQIPQLTELTRHADARIRADACHYLALSGATSVQTSLQQCLDDPDQEVREVAQDALELLAEQISH